MVGKPPFSSFDHDNCVDFIRYYFAGVSVPGRISLFDEELIKSCGFKYFPDIIAYAGYFELIFILQ